MSTTPVKILIVDDEPDIVEFISYNLRKEGFQVLAASNGEDAINLAIEELPDLIILDIMMPGLDGVEVCRRLRENPLLDNTVILFLTARGEDYSEIAGLEAGADDYITKPIRPRVLLARINALLKRKKRGEYSDLKLKFGDVEVDIEKRLVTKNGEKIDLTKKEFDLLSLLASKPGKIFTRDEIYLRLWGNSVKVSERTLDVHIRKLREKIGENYIRTSKGTGYGIDF